MLALHLRACLQFCALADILAVLPTLLLIQDNFTAAEGERLPLSRQKAICTCAHPKCFPAVGEWKALTEARIRTYDTVLKHLALNGPSPALAAAGATALVEEGTAVAAGGGLWGAQGPDPAPP